LKGGWSCLLAGAMALAGCRKLPDIAAGECGNAVLEPPEDCDRFVPEGLVCRPRGTTGQCRFDCRPGVTGARPSCPIGWGCDGEGICRAPTGGFEARVEHKVGGVSSLLAGDFDGDGRTDILSRGALDGAGQSKIAFHYFDERGGLLASRSFPKLVGTPVVGRLDDDALADVIFLNQLQMGLLLGRGDRSWVPETFGQYRAVKERLRIVSIHEVTVQGMSPVVAFTSLEGVPGLYVARPETGVLAMRGALPGPVEALVSVPVAGNLFSDPARSPCAELVIALRGASQFEVADSCVREGGPSGPLVWREQVEQQVVTLAPAAPIDAQPVISDFNHDGHLDVLIGAGGRPYLALGDGQQLAQATPFRLTLANPGQLAPLTPDIAMPLAAGDWTGDGFPDFVLASGLLLSETSAGSTLPSYFHGLTDPAYRWTEAVIADLNGNGKLDVAAASDQRLDIDFFNGTGTRRMSPFRISTSGSVKHLAVEDYDGDLVQDLAYIELGASTAEDDSVMVAFGAPAGPPATGLPIARVGSAQQLTSLREEDYGQLALVTSEILREVKSDVLTFFTPGGDRVPLAPYLLSSFVSNRSVQGWASISLTAGRFTGGPRADVLALATLDLKDWQFWLIPAVATPGGIPLRIEVPFDPRLEPAVGTPDDNLRISVASTSADVDQDGKDEGLWLMPAEGGTRCGLAVVGGAPLLPRPPVILDHLCPSPRLLPLDADSDGRPDLALLTGTAGQPGRQLVILWNDGQGFATRSQAVLSGSDSPEDFTVLPPAGDRPLELIYVTAESVRQVATTATPRTFAAARTLGPLSRGTGIVAADVTGDGLADLVVVDSGHLGLMKAQVQIQ
jgi:hypothetical protein